MSETVIDPGLEVPRHAVKAVTELDRQIQKNTVHILSMHISYVGKLRHLVACPRLF